MWKYLFFGGLIALSSCGAKNAGDDGKLADDAAVKSVATVNIKGQWLIENVVENDSSYVRPTEIEGGVASYIDFKDDDTFGIMTNCNHIGGNYTVNGDSLSLSDISYTELACDNMEIEEKLKKVLPLVEVVDCINDSITRLNTSKGDAYIVLKKSSLSLK